MRAPLRVKLLLVSLLLLIIPLLGMRFNSSLKASLLASQEDTLSLTATAVATAVGTGSLATGAGAIADPTSSDLTDPDLFVAEEACRLHQPADPVGILRPRLVTQHETRGNAATLTAAASYRRRHRQVPRARPLKK